MMKMFFHFGLEGPLLFQSLVLDSSLSLTLSCAVLFIVAILYEAIKYYRSVRCGCPAELCNTRNHKSNGTNNCCQHDTVLDSVDGRRDAPVVVSCQVGRKRTEDYRLLQTGLHLLQTVIAYVLMLAVMTFNVCIFSSIIFGSTVGYFVFYRAYTELESIESCH